MLYLLLKVKVVPASATSLNLPLSNELYQLMYVFLLLPYFVAVMKCTDNFVSISLAALHFSNLPSQSKLAPSVIICNTNMFYYCCSSRTELAPVFLSKQIQSLKMWLLHSTHQKGIPSKISRRHELCSWQCLFDNQLWVVAKRTDWRRLLTPHSDTPALNFLRHSQMLKCHPSSLSMSFYSHN